MHDNPRLDRLLRLHPNFVRVLDTAPIVKAALLTYLHPETGMGLDDALALTVVALSNALSKQIKLSGELLERMPGGALNLPGGLLNPKCPP